jgi:DNA-3-methyladenine glycosylase
VAGRLTPLPRGWFERPSHLVAPDLLNKVLVSRVGGELTSGRIIEVEAYDESDPASHSFRGPTARNFPMFGPAGHLYVYLSYGIHFCANVVTGDVGIGSAVLLRAVSPLTGLPTMRSRRGLPRNPQVSAPRTGSRTERPLADGPGKLCQAFGIDLVCTGIDLLDTAALVYLADDGTDPPTGPRIGPRIGITKAVDTPWRFTLP